MCAGAHNHVYISVTVCMHASVCVHIYVNIEACYWLLPCYPPSFFRRIFLKLQHLFQTHMGSGCWQLLCFLHKCPEFNYR